MKEVTEYEIEKAKHKRLLVRNEFRGVGKYNIPVVRKQFIDLNKIRFVDFTKSKANNDENAEKTLHFFMHDWKFDKVYDKPDDEVEKIKQYYAALTPDFSLFTDMPLALQIQSVFKNRWCGAYWQSIGLRVIPTVAWGDERSFEFCFDGVEEGSIVAVCTYYRENCEDDFMPGYDEMLKRIKPSTIICYGEPFEQMRGNVKSFLPTQYEWTKNLDWKQKAQFEYDRHNRYILRTDH